MLLYKNDLKQIELQNKIINSKCILNTFKYYYNKYKKFEKLFSESEEKNKNNLYEDKYYDFYKLSLHFSVTLTRKDDLKQELGPKQIDYIYDEINNNLEAYKEVSFYYSVQYRKNYKFTDKNEEFIFSSAFFTIPKYGESFYVITDYDEFGHGKQDIMEDITFFQDMDSRIPDKFDNIIKNRFIIEEICSISIGYIIGTIVAFLLYFAKVDFINDIISFIITQLLLSFIIGNILMYIYLNSLYSIIYYKITGFNSLDKQEEKKYIETCEYQFGDYINKKESRNKIKKIYSSCKKLLLYDFISFVIIVLLLFFVIFR